MTEYKFQLEILAPASWFPKPAPSERQRRRKGTASVSAPDKTTAEKEVKAGYKNLGIKVLKIIQIEAS